MMGDIHALEAIVNMKEPKGSDRAAIASYIEVKYVGMRKTRAGRATEERAKSDGQNFVCEGARISYCIWEIQVDGKSED